MPHSTVDHPREDPATISGPTYLSATPDDTRCGYLRDINLTEDDMCRAPATVTGWNGVRQHLACAQHAPGLRAHPAILTVEATAWR